MDLVYNFIIITVVILTFNIVGRVLLYFSGLNIKSNKIELAYTIIGLLISVFTYAAYLTSFKTVLWGIPLILTIIWLFNNYNKKIFFNKKHFFKWNFNSIIIILIPSWIWTLFYFIQFNEYTFFEDSIRSVHQDMLFYVKIGEIISQSGSENTLGNLNLIESNLGSTPYHYFEIYLNQMIKSIFKLNGVVSYLQIVFPLCLSLVCGVISSILNEYLPNLKKYQIVIYSVLLVFICGIHLPLPITEAGGYTMNLPNQAVAKYAFPFIFFLIGMWSLLKDKSLNFIHYLWFIPIVSYATLAPIMFVSFVVLFYNILFKSKFRVKENYSIILISTIMPIFLFTYYKIFEVDPSLNLMDFNIELVLSNFLTDYKVFLNIFFASHIYYWLDYGLYALFFIIIILISKKIKSYRYLLKFYNDKRVLVPILIFWGGLISWGLLREVHIDAFQTFIIPVALTSNAILVILFVSFLANYKNYKKIKIAILIVLFAASLNGIYNTFMHSYIFNGERFLSYQCSEKFYLKSKRILRMDDTYNNKIAIFNPKPIYGESYPIGIFLYLQNSRTTLMCISPELMIKKKVTNIIAPFHQFYIKNPKLKIEEAQLAFVKKYNIKYFLTKNKNLIPENMLKTSSLVASDNVNNYFLYKMRL